MKIQYMVALTLVLLLSADAVFGEKREALVIGNAAYADGPLRNPVNDAKDMEKALLGYGFSVVSAYNADRRQMRDVIRTFGERIRQGGVGLFYYAGHGLQVDGENYLVPIGTRVFAEDEVEDECLRASSVLRKMETAGNRLNIIILDACRNNPFARKFRSTSRGLARMDAPSGSILAYATAPGKTAADGEGRNGLYTEKLLHYMKTPDLEIGQLFRKVRQGVMEESGNRQVPWESSSLTGNFYFLPEEGAASEKSREEVPDKGYGKSDGRISSGAKTDPTTEKESPKKRQPVVSQVHFTADNISAQVRPRWWKWTVFLVGEEQYLNQVNCVEYTLHPTFPNPVRTVCRKGDNRYPYALSAAGWGVFTIRIRVFLRSGETYSLSHDLKFR